MNEPPVNPRRIAVVGGGISGLSAAFRTRELDPSCELTLFEAGSRLGGVISTVHEQGFQVEQSADNFITTVPWGLELCKRLGLADELMQTNGAFRQTFVVHAGRLHKLPDGFLMMAPTRLWPMALTPILSPLGKLRAGWEYFIPPRRDDADESMAAFARRRLGREVFARLIEPLVSSVYAADMEKLSVDATLSQFREMELAHGSLIRAMRRRMASQSREMPRRGSGDSGARYSMFVTPRRGLGAIVDAMEDRLPTGSIRLESRVASLRREADGGWRLLLADGGEDRFDGVILAAPSYETARLLEPHDPILAAEMGAIEHSGTAVLSVGFRREQVRHPLDGMGAVVPAIEHSPILACSFSSQKYPHRAPDGTLLLRIFAGGARRPELATMDDAQLIPLLLAELDRFLGIAGPPIYQNIAHWPRTMPQYHVGHKQRVARIEGCIAGLPNLEVCGNAFHGVGLPHCIHSGQRAAERLLGVGANRA